MCRLTANIQHPITRSAALRLYLRSIWNADSRVIWVPVALGLCFIVEISRNGWFESICSRDFMDDWMVYN
jgi:hypothetical protein